MLAEQHCRCSLGKMLANVSPIRDGQQSPLCQAAFQMQRQQRIDADGVAALWTGQAGHHLRHGRFTLEGLGAKWQFAPVELTLRVEEAGGQIYGSWLYRSDLFSPGAIGEMHNSFVEMLQDVVLYPFATPAELRVILREPTAGDESSTLRRQDTKSNGDTIRIDGPERATAAPSFVAPRSETEQLVARVWEEMLDVRPIGLREDFFASGGHSLNLTLMCAKLQRIFSVELRPRRDHAASDRGGLVGLDRCAAGCEFAPCHGPD